MNEQAIFLAALEIVDLDQRAEYVKRACEGQPALRRAVSELLAAHERSGEFLDLPALHPLEGKDLELRVASNETSAEHPSLSREVELSFLQPSAKPGSLGRLVHYEVEAVIGQGGCGIVLKAFDERLHRAVAIKVMSPELAATSPARKRFLREARATAAIRHENVVSIHAVEEQPLPFLVMEYIDGQTLQQKIDQAGPLDPRDVLRIGQEIASGLAAAHAKGLIHRDIKPANILLENGRDRVKITDFGLARSADDASMTQSGVITGTPLYMSPEQAQAREIDQRSDLFSLGSVLYVMCSGRPPFRAATSIAVLRRVVEEQPRPIQEVIPETPAWLVAIITKLHAKKPEDRFTSAQELADLLERCLTEHQQLGRVELPEDVFSRSPQSFCEPQKQVSVNHSASEVPLTFARANGYTFSRGRNWAVLAVVVLTLLAGLGMAEATGVTQVRSTIIRLFSPDGTLVVETDDPAISVSIDGEEMVITGAGAKEIRLKPGQYKVLARKDGKLLRQELVTVTTNNRQVVRVSLEGTSDFSDKPRARRGDGVVEPRGLTLPSPAAVLASLRQEQISAEALTFAGEGDPKKAPTTLVAVLGKPEPIHLHPIARMAFSSDGKWLASAATDQTILLREVSTLNVVRVSHSHNAEITCLAFTPDSKTIITGDVSGMVQLWPIEGQGEPTNLHLPLKKMRAAVSRDGRYLAAGGADGKVKLWKWNEWDKPRELPVVHQGELSALTFSADGELLACGWSDKESDNRIALFQTDEGTRMQIVPGHKSIVRSLVFSDDGKYLASAGDGATQLWDLTASQSVDIPENALGADALAICFSPDSQRLAVGPLTFGGNFRVFDIPTRTIVNGTGKRASWASVKSLVFSPDGKTLVVGDQGGSTRFYDTADWQLNKRYWQSGHRCIIEALAISPNGKTILSRGTDNTLRRWDLDHPNEHRIVMEYDPMQRELAYSPDGQTYATGEGSPLIVFDAATNKQRFTIPISVSRVAYSPDGKLLAGSGMGGDLVHLVDVQLGKVVHRFPSPNQQAFALAFSDDGRLLAAAGSQGKCVVWNVDSGAEVARWQTTRSGSIAFHPDGSYLAIGHVDGTIAYWDTSSWEKKRSFQAHLNGVPSLRFTPDGSTLLSSSVDGVIQVRSPDQDRTRTVISVGPAGMPVRFDLDASGKYLFASGPTPLIYVHRLPDSN